MAYVEQVGTGVVGGRTNSKNKIIGKVPIGTGRYTPEDVVEKLVLLMDSGAPLKELSVRSGVSTTTLQRWYRKAINTVEPDNYTDE